MWRVLLSMTPLWACTGTPSVVPRTSSELQGALALPWSRTAGAVHEGEGTRLDGYGVRSLALEPGLGLHVGAALFEPDEPGKGGVIVAQGHFGEGKSAPEAQDMAHRLAASGVRVLVVDTPGMEEWETAAMALHFDAGAHHRALLWSLGSSPLALELAGLQAGLDLLEERGSTELIAMGASNGATQAFYLGLVDPRVQGLVLASPPPLPRERRVSGCACDLLPGLVGPDPAALAALDQPSLWLADVAGPRPEGLGRKAEWVVVPGEHGFSTAMQELALPWVLRRLGGRARDLEVVPRLELRGPGPDALSDARSLDEVLQELARAGGPRWSPQGSAGGAYELSCTGRGPTVVLLGAQAGDVAAVVGAGLRACRVDLPVAEGDLEAALADGGVLADQLVGAGLAASRAQGAKAAWGTRGWGLVAASLDLPFVLREPLGGLDQVDPVGDPPWIHVPGAWSGGNEAFIGRAVAAGEEPGLLATALSVALTGEDGVWSDRDGPAAPASQEGPPDVH